MARYAKRAMITLLPEWETELDQLKKDEFYNKTQADMYRYLIRKGLDALKAEQAHNLSKNSHIIHSSCEVSS